MTSKIYRSAQGKPVDLGVLTLQNEHVRAVGNMKVNARGDKIDSQNRVIETKSQQIQKQNDRSTTTMSSAPVQSSSIKARQASQPTKIEPDLIEPEIEVQELESIVSPPEPEPEPKPEQKTNTSNTAQKEIIPPMPAPEVDFSNSVSPATNDAPSTKGGLAGAIARSREIKQDLDRTRRQKAQDSGVRKI